MVTTEQQTPGRATVAQRWQARLSLAAAAAAVLVPLVAIGFKASLAVTLTGVVGLAVAAAGVWWALTHKGVVRWLATAVAVLAPLVVLVLYTSRGCCGWCWWRWGCWSGPWPPAGRRCAAMWSPTRCASTTPRRPPGRI